MRDVAKLVEIVGAPLTAYIADVSETRAVSQWIRGERKPGLRAKAALRIAYQLAKLLQDNGEAGAIEAWFQGLNPELENFAPAEILHTTSTEQANENGRRLLQAARVFCDG